MTISEDKIRLLLSEFKVDLLKELDMRFGALEERFARKDVVDDHETRLRVVESVTQTGSGEKSYKTYLYPILISLCANAVGWWLFVSSSHAPTHLP